MSDYFLYCNDCGDRLGEELTEVEAAEEYVVHEMNTGHDELFIKKELEP